MKLEQFFKDNPKVAIAFSGGVDSAYLLYAALQSGADVKAYYGKTAFQPQFELNDALRLAKELGAQLEILPIDILCHPEVTTNPADRCYHCKKLLIGTIAEKARHDGYDLLLDGTNASDDAADRPGMQALQQLAVCSPLRQCGLSKDYIRRLSREAGLFTHNKPAYACLATRIPTSETITAEKLQRTELAEAYLSSLGFRNFRVRSCGNTAKLQVTAADLIRLMLNRGIIVNELKKHYDSVTLDLEVRK